jgi:hypothetical protein
VGMKRHHLLRFKHLLSFSFKILAENQQFKG